MGKKGKRKKEAFFRPPPPLFLLPLCARCLAHQDRLQRRAEPRPPVGPVPRRLHNHPRVCQRDPRDGGPAGEEQQVRNGAHPVEPSEVGRLVKVVADVVLQKDDSRAARARLARGVLPGTQGLLAGAAGAGVEGDGEDGGGCRRGEGVLVLLVFGGGERVFF